jgi:hypothetical protein
MPIIANTTSGNTFSAVRAQLNSVTKRINQFAINESAIYANTITANSTLRISGGVIANGSLGTSNYVLRTNGTTVYWAPGGGSTAQYLQVANAVATYQTKAVERAALANTNSSIATQTSRINLINTNLTGTNTALRTLISDRLQVANAAAVYQTKAVERAALANTNAYIGAQATRITLVNTNLTGTNTALRSLISDRLQVSNAASVYQTKAVERAALANTNSYIGTQATRINLINTNLTGTNTALRTLISDRLQVANAATTYQTRAIERAALANTNSSIATQTSRITLVNTNLTGTNTALRTLISDRLQVANASTLYATKSNPTTSGLLAHTGRATISTNLTVSGNTILSGTLVANGSPGTSGYYLRTSGTGIYWSPVSASGGGGANGFSGILVGANVVVAAAATTRVSLIAGSGIRLAANPTTRAITIATSTAATANIVSKSVKDLTQNDTVVTSVNGVVVAGSATGGGTDKVFYENDITITTSYTIGTNKNAMTAGPITINSGVTVTVPSGSVWSII